MRLVVLMADADLGAWERATPEQREQVFAQHAAFDQAVRERGTMLAGEALSGSAEARTLRPGPGRRTVTDGPYAETAEQLGGFYLVDLDSVDTAVELCRLLPPSYSVEVRPVLELGEDESPG